MQNKTLGLLTMLAIVGSIPEPRNISESPNDAAFYPDVEIAASGLGVVVWSDERTLGERRIYVARSSNGGITWSDPEMASTTGGESMFPDALFVGSQVFLVLGRRHRYKWSCGLRERAR